MKQNHLMDQQSKNIFRTLCPKSNSRFGCLFPCECRWCIWYGFLLVNCPCNVFLAPHICRLTLFLLSFFWICRMCRICGNKCFCDHLWSKIDGTHPSFPVCVCVTSKSFLQIESLSLGSFNLLHPFLAMTFTKPRKGESSCWRSYKAFCTVGTLVAKSTDLRRRKLVSNNCITIL